MTPQSKGGSGSGRIHVPVNRLQRIVVLIAPFMVFVLPAWLLFGDVMPQFAGWTSLGMVSLVIPVSVAVQVITLALVLLRGRKVERLAAGPNTAIACAVYWALSFVWPLSLGAVGDAPGEVAPLVRWGVEQHLVNSIAMITSIGGLAACVAMVICAVHELDPQRSQMRF